MDFSGKLRIKLVTFTFWGKMGWYRHVGRGQEDSEAISLAGRELVGVDLSVPGDNLRPCHRALS